MTEIILQDRVNSDKWSIQIEDGQLKFSTSLGQIIAEPIIRDVINPDNFWKLFISDGELGIESTDEVNFERVILEDIITGQNWQLFISDGQFNYAIGISTDVWNLDSAITKLFSLSSGIIKTISLESGMTKTIISLSEITKEISMSSQVNKTISKNSSLF